MIKMLCHQRIKILVIIVTDKYLIMGTKYLVEVIEKPFL